MYVAQKPITTLAQLEAQLHPMHPSQVNKIIDHADTHIRAWLARTTFVAISSCDAAGNMDVSPKGDPAGFIAVIDDKTLAIPDRIGNFRADTFRNVLENPRVGMMCMVPRRKEVVRINGRAEIVQDDALRDQTTRNGHRPDFILLVRIEEAFFHCGKAVIRSGLWQADSWGPVDDLPSYAQALKDHGDMDMPLSEIAERMAHNEKDRLY